MSCAGNGKADSRRCKCLSYDVSATELISSSLFSSVSCSESVHLASSYWNFADLWTNSYRQTIQRPNLNCTQFSVCMLSSWSLLVFSRRAVILHCLYPHYYQPIHVVACQENMFFCMSYQVLPVRKWEARETCACGFAHGQRLCGSFTLLLPMSKEYTSEEVAKVYVHRNHVIRYLMRHDCNSSITKKVTSG